MITGARGFVAGSIMGQAGKPWEVHAVSRGEALLQRPTLRWHQFDPGDTVRLLQVFREVRPDAVIHTAALADIDFCEAHPDQARRMNVSLTQTIAELCTETGAKLVFCSTDTVFDGEQAPYREQDPTGPLNFYAATKVEAEIIVARLNTNFVIARLALVIGLPILGAGNSFLSRMFAELQQGREVGVSPNEIRTPIDVITLGRALLELAGNGHAGIIHLAGNDRLNRFEMARRVATRFGFPTRLIVAKDPSAIPGRAARPRDVSLDNSLARAQLETSMRSLDEGLDLILQNRKHPPA